MPRIQFPGFIAASYATRSIVHGCERLINLYVEQNPSTEQPALYGTPGLKRFVYLQGGPIRALYVASNARVFAVAGPNVYELYAGGSALLRGSVGGSGPLSMADNGLVLLLVDGTNGWQLDFGTNTFQRIVDPDFPPATVVAFLDGYFVLNVPGTGRFMVTGLYTTSIDGLDLATAEASADPLVTLAVDHRELWLFGTQTTEVWFNSGNPAFPLERIAGAVLEQGCGAPWSVQAMDNTLYWLHSNRRGTGALIRARGYQPEEITPPALEWAWGQYPRLDDARAYTYRQSGHTYYVLSFPSGKATWALDTTTGMWHERAYLEPDGTLGPHLAWCHAFGFGLHLVGDYRTGMVYELDEHTYTDDGREIARIRRAPHIRNNGSRVTHHALEVQVETGVGVDGGAPQQNVDPQAMLTFSNDQGKTWSFEHWTSLGKLGDYQKRVIWRRLGQSRNRVYELRVTAGVPVAITGAWLELSEGKS